MLLVGIGVTGVVVAVRREHDATSVTPRIANPWLMLAYGAVETASCVAAAAWYFCARDQLQASVTDVRDMLNMRSCLAHVFASMVGGIVILATSVWVLLTYPEVPDGTAPPRMAWVA